MNDIMNEAIACFRMKKAMEEEDYSITQEFTLPFLLGYIYGKNDSQTKKPWRDEDD